jgi:hypothetical protein
MNHRKIIRDRVTVMLFDSVPSGDLCFRVRLLSKVEGHHGVGERGNGFQWDSGILGAATIWSEVLDSGRDGFSETPTPVYTTQS